MRILIAAGTGYLGKELTKHFLKDPDNIVMILSRSERKSDNPRISYSKWDGKSIDPTIGNFDVVINLAGAPIGDKRWTDSYRKEIIDSRVDSSKACVEFINQCDQKPKVLLGASGVGYYGGDREGEVDETSTAGTDFMGEVCVKWENAYSGAECRTVLLRTTVVLGEGSKPLDMLKLPYKMFGGGRVASGNQYIPWIHIVDWIGAVDFLIKHESISGGVILGAPQQVTQNQFGKMIGKHLNRPHWSFVPKFVLSIAMGERSILAWGNMQANPKVLKDNGFEWKYPELDKTLGELLRD